MFLYEYKPRFCIRLCQNLLFNGLDTWIDWAKNTLFSQNICKSQKKAVPLHLQSVPRPKMAHANLCTLIHLTAICMHYIEVKFNYSFPEDYLLDLFIQGLADRGFDSFTDDAAYVPENAFHEAELRRYVAQHGQTIQSIARIEDQNWNAAWEAEHPVMELPLGVHITPHGAFGAGYHETTSMMIDALLTRDLTGKTVLDMGCGTGVLAIFACKQGAARVVAVDIDEKSVANTIENAAGNQVTIDVRLGDSVPNEPFHLIMANIHRNILINQMQDYARTLLPDGELWLSGFYEQDCEPVISEGARYGLRTLSKNEREEWRMLRMIKQSNE